MKVKFYTLGCKVNQYESQALQEEFSACGFTVTEELADIYVINSCSVTAKADSDSRRLVLKAKKENPKAKIAVCGCWPQLNADAAKKIGADYVVGQDRKQSLVDIIKGITAKPKDIWSLKINGFTNQRTFVKIQDGCNNFCSFCKVPFLRGGSISRPGNDVIKEIERLEIRHKEIVLCGVNLGAYGKDLLPETSLYDLLKTILHRNSLTRLRLSSLEPNSVDERIIGLFAHPKMCPHIHLPFQNGDNRVLKEMNKKETVEMYEQIAACLRKLNPKIAISCDIIVGFPGEDEASFNNTVNFLNKIKPMRTHIFTFSSREKTRFYGQKINPVKAKARFRHLKNITDSLAMEYKMAFLGKTLNLVVEEKKSGYLCGYTENYIKLHAKGEARPGEIITVQINKVDKDKAFGIIVEGKN
ncbi:MAG: tRNA (N(6)-L-threonylcarbamoyladenosine(37)-C(2))-methylthiotransferase MtaB [Candidatus Omnitrophica bacterium]|jgi:threonylcarbamoyladenosine tRNA methylthiotransferase MtaB|nr:tRNA (N(6)-L-threonylcarbamoyladenosine(37)-C(2))-methylthiotransferase MtaB [Candidatus Omnitrophota bacterium]